MQMKTGRGVGREGGGRGEAEEKAREFNTREGEFSDWREWERMAVGVETDRKSQR